MYINSAIVLFIFCDFILMTHLAKHHLKSTFVVIDGRSYTVFLLEKIKNIHIVLNDRQTDILFDVY